MAAPVFLTTLFMGLGSVRYLGLPLDVGERKFAFQHSSEGQLLVHICPSCQHLQVLARMHFVVDACVQHFCTSCWSGSVSWVPFLGCNRGSLSISMEVIRVLLN